MTGCSSACENQITLKYGKGEVSLDIRKAASVEYLTENEMPAIDDLQAAYEAAVGRDAIGSPLQDRLQAGDAVTIVISDITRFWMRQDKILALLIAQLEQIEIRDIRILVALGTHRFMTEAELKQLTTEDVYSRYPVINHDCDAPDLVSVGTTSHGNEIFVNPLVVGRKVIVISGTVHHLMAGYGGGRKSILPGVSSRQTIRRNHVQCLDPNEPHSSHLIGSGLLKTNPVDGDMLEAARMVSPIFGISIVVNSHQAHAGLFAGDFEAAWEESCRFCQRYYCREISHEADVVICSCGGFPKDLNLYQGVKSLLNGINALKKGGTFVFLAECPDGGGSPDFFSWIEPLNRGELDPALRAAFTIGGYIFYASCEAIAKAGQFLMLSGFEPETVAGMGIRSFKSMDELTKQLDLEGKSVYVIPYGGSVLPQPTERFNRLNREVRL